MTARREPAVKGRDTGLWYDEPSALRRGVLGQEGVNKLEKGKNVVKENREESDSGELRGQARNPQGEKKERKN